MDDGCAHHRAEGPHLYGPALAAALAEAEARCARDRQKLTAPRRRVLELLLAADGPVKAYDLMAAFGTGADGAPAKPPTVYRALEFLEAQGFAHRIESLNAYVACRLGDDAHAAAFLICTCCGATKEVEPKGASALAAAAAADAGYSLTGLTVEARGLCPACRSV